MTAVDYNDPFVQRLAQIRELIVRGDLMDAAKGLNEAQKLAPRDPRVLILGMLMTEKAGNIRAALDLGRRAAEAAPDWIVAQMELALLFARQRMFQDAINQAHKSLALDPKNAQALLHAVDIAHRAQHLPQAIEWLQRAMEQMPDNAHLQHLLARDLGATGTQDKALEMLTALHEQQPDKADVLFDAVRIAVALHKKRVSQQLAKKLVALEPDNETYKFWQEMAHGRMPTTQPARMVQDLHDSVADVFDQLLVNTLDYHLPDLVAKRIKSLHPDLKLNVLDLGCGTGLLGQRLGQIDGALIGVDVSLKMIEQAARHNVYARFHTVNLLEALQVTPENLYEVIAACDVFNYVGELSQAIPNAYRVLLPGGHLIFSCEAAPEDGENLVLNTETIRYTHKQSHVQALCKAAGFDTVEIETTVIRMEDHKPVNGFVVVAHKPA